MAADPDTELFQRIRDKDPLAMQELYRRHGRAVYGVAAAVCPDVSTAEEVTQDVFLRAWNKADTYKPEKAKVVTWLTRIARNGCIDELRRGAARGAQSRDAEAALERFLDPRAVDPGDSAQLTAMRQRVRAAVATLPPELRRVLWLGFYGGLTHLEIAGKLGAPLGTVKTRMREALRRLREALTEESP